MDLAAAFHVEMVETVKGYRHAGYFLTGHEHWKIDERSADAGARLLETVMARMSPEGQLRFTSSLFMFRALTVGSLVFLLPVQQSIKFNKAEKLRRAQEAAKPKEPPAEQAKPDGAN